MESYHSGEKKPEDLILKSTYKLCYLTKILIYSTAGSAFSHWLINWLINSLSSKSFVFVALWSQS